MKHYIKRKKNISSKLASILIDFQDLKKICGSFIVMICCFSMGYAQLGGGPGGGNTYTISGPASVLDGGTYGYTLSGNAISTVTWGINSSYGSVVSSTLTTANIVFSASGTTTVDAAIQDTSGNFYFATFNVTVNAGLSAGSIAGAQTICYNGNPGNLSNSAAASGGSGGYSYQWQYSNNGSSGWSNISGAIATSYNPPGNLTASRWYRRRVISGSITKYTASVKVSVNAALTAGSVNGVQTVCYSADPGILGNSNSPANGLGGYAYQWQYSNNGSSGWTNIGAATGSTYNPPSGLTSSRWYRRRVVSCGQTKYTGSVKVTVTPNLAAGAITGAQTICSGGDPGNLGNSATASGGNGAYAYQWQYSANGSSSWTNINGATSTAYNPPANLISSRWYRRRAISCNQTKYTNVVEITVTPSITWYADTDNDGYGNASSSITGCTQPTGYVSNDDDYDDTTGNITNIAPQYFYNDVDNDGLGDPNDSVYYSVQPTGYVSNNTDQCPLIPSPTNNCGSAPPTNDFSYSESFENTLGDWTQDTGDDFNWTLKTGGTPSTGTGPTGAIDGTHYIYVEVSNPNYPTKTAILNSPNFDLSTINTAAIQFSYQMTGDAVGTVKLEVSIDNGVHWTEVWSKTGDQGVSWLEANVDLAPYTGNTVKLRFHATSGTSWQGDIAIDKLSIEGNPQEGGSYQEPTLSNENYVFTRSYQTPLDASNGIVSTKDVIESVSYLDGLGRARQSIGIKAAPDKKDIITHMEYDDYGRQTKTWLPYQKTTGAVGSYRTGNIGTEIQQYYEANYAEDFVGMNTGSINAYTQSEFESSPLPRTLKQAAPGKDWKLGNGHEIQFNYQTNAIDEVRYYRVTTSFANNTYTPSLVADGFYAAGKLNKTVTKDENWTSGTDHTTKEFTNKSGQVLLKRTYNGTAHDTYYVYDNYGNLSYVLPPKVTTADGISSTELNELCYQYKYDHRNRLVEKKIPGKGTSTTWEEIVYNKLDQPIMTRDPNLRTQNKWLFTKYDAFARVVYTGIIDLNLSRLQAQSAADSSVVQYEEKSGQFYTLISYPSLLSTSYELHTVNYYDTYDFDLKGYTLPTSIYGQTVSQNVKLLPTGSDVKVLDGGSTESWIRSIILYDEKGRAIGQVSRNDYLNTFDFTETKLDFTGRPLQVKTSHTKDSNAAIVTMDHFSYDHMGRLLKQEQELAGQTTLIAANTYDDLGQLIEKKVGNTESNSLQTVDYSYNVRGWLKTINDVNSIGNDLFSFKINYNDPSSGTALYNGNISQTFWKTANTDSSLKNYTYDYDALNRIVHAEYYNPFYDLENVSYDKNGNITALTRIGHKNATASSFGTMDNLIYTYDSGNKLTKVRDNGYDAYGFKDGTNTNDDFEYDANGNMKIDRNKGITNIEYNHLNLPTQVSVSGNGNMGVITYIYAADGIKLEKMVSNTGEGSLTATEYCGNYIYERIGTNPVELKFFSHPEGYIEPDGNGGYDYVYQYKDHLGNIRLSYSDDNGDGSVGISEIREENNYYPFGLKHKGYNNNVTSSSIALKYKYNGKEFNDELGLNWYDYGARNYEASLGRWFVIDALANDEMQIDKSPYSYAWNRPIEVTDPDGNCPWCIGAIIGALTEYAVQASINLAKGDNLGDALWNNIDGADVVFAGTEGALTGGASVVRRLAVRATTEVASAAIDYNGDGTFDIAGVGKGKGVTITGKSEKTKSGIVSDATIGLAFAEGGDKIAKKLSNISSDRALKSATSDVHSAAKNLDKANNIRATGNSTKAARGSKSKNPNEAFKDFTKAKQVREVTGSLNKAIGKFSEETVTRTFAVPVTGATAVIQEFFQNTVIPVFNFEQ